MSTQSTTIGVQWTNIVSTLSLSIGITYRIEGFGTRGGYVQFSDTMPGDNAPGHILKNDEDFKITPENGLGIWMRVLDESTTIVVTPDNLFSAQSRGNTVLYDDSAAATGAWMPTTSGPNDRRTIFGQVTAGDEISIEATTISDVSGTVASEDIATPITYTEDFCDVLVGDWTYVRIVKTGTNGNSKVQGAI